MKIPLCDQKIGSALGLPLKTFNAWKGGGIRAEFMSHIIFMLLCSTEVIFGMLLIASKSLTYFPKKIC